MIKPITLKNGSVRWLVRVKDRAGNQMPAKTFKRKVDAVKFEAEEKVRIGNCKIAQRSAMQKLTFNEYFRKWFSECRFEISEGWRNDQLRMANEYILPHVGTVKLSSFSNIHVSMILNSLRSLGRKEQTILHVYNLLHKAFQDAIEHYGALVENPVSKRYKPQVMIQEQAFLNPTQSRRLLEFAKADPLGPAIWLSILASLRPSEVIALKFKSIDFGLGQLLIEEAYKRKVKRIEPFPKQKRIGLAVMPLELITYLQSVRGNKTDEDFVANITANELLSYHVFYHGLQKICKTLQIPIVSPKGLRHSSTELMVEAGASQEDIRRQLNHSSLHSTKSYMHRTDERLRKIVNGIVVTEVMQNISRPHLSVVKNPES